MTPPAGGGRRRVAGRTLAGATRQAWRSVAAVLLAAGRGERAGGLVAKQFTDLAGRPLLVHALQALEGCTEVRSIVVVLPPDPPDFIHAALAHPKVVAVTTGGATRQASLGQGLACLPEDTSVVAVHDAARPLVRAELVAATVAGLTGGFGGCVCAIRVEDALKEVSAESEVLHARSRRSLWRAQTPQVFVRDALEDALARADAEGLVAEDCSEMVTGAGYRVRIVQGDPWNLKVTRPQDLALCERILEVRAAAAASRVAGGPRALEGAAGPAGPGEGPA